MMVLISSLTLLVSMDLAFSKPEDIHIHIDSGIEPAGRPEFEIPSIFGDFWQYGLASFSPTLSPAVPAFFHNLFQNKQFHPGQASFSPTISPAAPAIFPKQFHTGHIFPVVNDDCTCGVSQKTEFGNRISGGREAIPHEFPWMVRITGGCAGTVCGGALVSPRVVLSAFHCATKLHGRSDRVCDHSDGKRLALVGRHNQYWGGEAVPIIKAHHPPNAELWAHQLSSHDFLLYELARPVVFSDTVGTICLPEPGADFSGEKVIAAGWGRTDGPSISTDQSPVLKAVELRVSRRKYQHKYLFGTEVIKKDGKYQDPCSGDSGGPLMYFNRTTSRFVLIGTVYGGGYDCREDRLGHWIDFNNNDGLWNKVSAHMYWIQETMEKLGEKVCR